MRRSSTQEKELDDPPRLLESIQTFALDLGLGLDRASNRAITRASNRAIDLALVATLGFIFGLILAPIHPLGLAIALGLVIAIVIALGLAFGFVIITERSLDFAASRSNPAATERTSGRRTNAGRRPIRVLKVLETFAWFCSIYLVLIAALSFTLGLAHAPEHPVAPAPIHLIGLAFDRYRCLAVSLAFGLARTFFGFLACALGRAQRVRVYAIPAESERAPDLRANAGRRPIRLLKILAAFAWFCSKENREHIECITADLKKDTSQMRREKRREVFIQCVLLWHVANTVLPIVWDGTRRIVAAILPIGKIISKIKGF